MMNFDQQEFNYDIESRIIEFMKDNQVPGLALSFFSKDDILYQRGFGSRDFQNYKPFTCDSLNGFASCTKSITCLAIMKLEREGKLSIDDPISKYLPITVGSKDEPITIHHLMTHTSGIPDLGIYQLTAYRRIPKDIGAKYVPMSSWEDFYTHVNHAGDELIKQPGEHYYYCNSGYTMLGKIIEVVSNSPYHNYVTENILEPIGMFRSGFTEDKVGTDKNLSMTYGILRDENSPRTLEFPFTEFLHAPGGLISSVNEMTKYIRMYLRDGEIDGEQVFDPTMLEKMREIMWKYPEGSSQFEDTGYGYGWRIIPDFHGYKVVLHTGGITGGASLVGFVPDLDIGFVGIGTGNFDFDTMFVGLAKIMGENNHNIRSVEIKAFQELLVGDYSTYKGGTESKITLKNGILHFETEKPFNSPFPLIPCSENPTEDKFYILNPDRSRSPVEFHVSESGVSFTLLRSLFHKN